MVNDHCEICIIYLAGDFREQRYVLIYTEKCEHKNTRPQSMSEIARAREHLARTPRMEKKKDHAAADSARKRGNEMFKSGDFDKAIKFYDVAASLGTGEAAAKAYQNAALCQIKVGAYEKACEAAGAALRIDPTLSKARRHRGIARYHLGQMGAALGDLRNVKKLSKVDKKVLDKLMHTSGNQHQNRQQQNTLVRNEAALHCPPDFSKAGNPLLDDGNGVKSLPAYSSPSTTATGVDTKIVTPDQKIQPVVPANPDRVVKLAFSPMPSASVSRSGHISTSKRLPLSPRTIVSHSSKALGAEAKHRANADDPGMPSISLEAQRKYIHRLWSQYDKLPGADAGMIPGENWYVVNQKWWDQWTIASGYRVGMVDAAPLSGTGGAVIAPSIIENNRLVHEKDLACILDDEEKKETPNTYLRLRPNLQEGRDFMLVPAEVWNAIVAWYGGGPPLPRRVARQDDNDNLEEDDANNFSVPVKLKCTVLLYPENGTRKQQAERNAALAKAKFGQASAACPSSVIGEEEEDDETDEEDEGETKEEEDVSFSPPFVNMRPEPKPAWLAAATAAVDSAPEAAHDPSGTVIDAGTKGTKLATSTGRKRSGKTPTETTVCGMCLKIVSGKKRCTRCKAVTYCSRECQKSHWKDHKSMCGALAGEENSETAVAGSNNKAKIRATTTLALTRKQYAMGRCGLHNLGNTCFMNSIIQCLSHTRPLTEYFLGGGWKQHGHLNPDNPLGFGGKIAEGWARLLKELWHGRIDRRAHDPRNFKRAVGKLARGRFSGFQQHDSQEMLIFLLDGLHEDVNLIKEKPYVENRESDGTEPDVKVAGQMWDDYCQRNKSIIVDTMTGQYKSQLTCPQCSRVSVTFDPYQYVTLSLPSTRIRTITVTVVRNPSRYCPGDPNSSNVLRHTVTVKPRDRCSAIKHQIERDLGLSAEDLNLLDIYEHGVYAIFHDNMAVSKIRKSDEVVCYESCTPGEEAGERGMTHVVVLHQVATGASPTSNGRNGRPFKWGVPLCISVPSGTETGRGLKNKILGSLYDVGMARKRTQGKTGDRLGEQVTIVLHECAKDGQMLGRKGFSIDLDIGAGHNSDFESDSADGGDMDNDGIANTPGLVEQRMGCKAGHITFVCIVWSTQLQEQLLGLKGGVPAKHLLKMSKLPAAGARMSNATGTGTVEGKTERKKASPGIHECLRDFSKAESLDRDNMWYCSKCKEHVQAIW